MSQKKKNRTNKVQSECKKDFHEFAQEFINSMSEDSDAVNKAEIQEDFENFYGICTLAWNLSLQNKTYEKSIDKVKSLQMKKFDPPARIYMKSLLVEALRMLFSLPVDVENVDQVILEVLSPEELKYHNETTS
jgi:hypothetical protein